MTDRELAEIRRRCAAVAPAPWVAYIEGRHHTSGSSFIMRGEGLERDQDLELIGGSEADHEFIAHARQDVPALLEEIGRLKALLAGPHG